MAPYPGLLWSSLAFLVGGVLFYVLSVSGLLWPEPSPPNDLGVYSFTAILVLFGAAGLLLRMAKIRPAPPA